MFAYDICRSEDAELRLILLLESLDLLRCVNWTPVSACNDD